ncbi:MAG: CHAT domain-containing protein [Acidobacteria bacterium]|nr:CHAT domain-containing protein [Acidobacteriota bacterium]
MPQNTRFLFSIIAVLLAFTGCGGAGPKSCAVEAESLRLYESGELVKARDLLLRAWQNPDASCRWRLKMLLADVYVLLRKKEEALQLLNSEPLPNAVADAIRYRFHLANGYIQERPEDLLQAMDIAAAAKNARWEVDAVLRLANLANRRGEADAAETYYSRAVAVAEQHADQRAAADAYVSHGFFLLRQERLGQAERALHKALLIAEKNNLPLVVSRCRGNLGSLYLHWGDYARALDLITRAEEAARLQGQTRDQIRMLLSLGNIQYLLGQHAVARNYFEQSLQLVRAGKDADTEAMILFNLSLANIELGNLADAEKQSEACYRLRLAAKQPNAAPLYRFTQARILRARGNLDAAASLLTQQLPQGRLLPWLSWSIHAEMAAIEEKRGHDSAADGHYHQAIRILHEARQEISSAASQFSFISENIGLHQQYIRFLSARGKPEAALRVADWSRAATGAARQMPAFTLAQISAVCRTRKETLIAFALGSRESYGWIVTPTRTQFAILPEEAKIRTAVERWEREMDAPQRETAAAAALYDMLFAPLLRPGERAGVTVLAADGVLHRINPEALWTGEKYWIEDGSVARISSIAAFVRNAPPRVVPRKLLIVGDPVPSSKDFPVLPGAAAEIEAVSRYFQATVLSGEAATPRAYRAAKPENYGYLHFATHSVPNAFDPMESMLVLSPAPGGSHLTARQIAAQPIRARLVTLASCRSAGDRLSAAGLLGLGFAFLEAGADSVIASLWDVADESAGPFSRNLYQALDGGATVEASARSAKLALLSSQPTPSPRGWSGWVVLRGSSTPKP